MMEIATNIADKYQSLFNLMHQEHGLILTIEEMDEIILESQKLVKNFTISDVSKPYYKGKWYYFGKCKPYPVQVDGYPVKPYKQFDTKEECQSYIDSAC